MTILADIALVLVALLHIAFLVLEMFLWSKPIGRRVFGLPPEWMAASAPLAANQGLYNGFLAAGVLWGLALGTPGFGIKVSGNARGGCAPAGPSYEAVGG